MPDDFWNFWLRLQWKRGRNPGAGGRNPHRRPPEPPSGHLQQLVPPAQCVDQLKLLGVQGIKAMEDIRRLPDHQPEVGQIEWDLLEAEDRPALQLVALEDVGVEVERRQRYPALDAPLQPEEFDVHVHGAAKFGMSCLDGTQLDDLA